MQGHRFAAGARRRISPRAIIGALSVMVFFLAVFGALQWYYSFLIRTPVDMQDSTRHEVTVEKGSTASSVASMLEREGLIRSSLAFTMYVDTQFLASKLAAGRFALRRDQSIVDIVKTLSNPAAAEQWITTLEGWRMEEIAGHLTEKEFAARDAFLECARTCIFDYDFLSSRPEGSTLEGYLFPDTYIVAGGASPQDIITTMLDNFDRKLTPDLRKDIAGRGRTIHQVVTMASIIEREVRTDKDRPIVAGILWKRYEEGMGLGADATVLYALGDWKALLTTKSLQIDSPYNTRRYAGLPPGPIANPGLKSIVAAAHPEESPYWYYLTTMDTGEVKYARTLEEHNENVRKFLR